MPISGQPTLAAGDVITVTQMNAWMTTLSNKFSSAITTADFRWPMKAGGDINMDGNGITGVPVMGTVYNLAERRPWVTSTQIFNEAEFLGGGTVLLPGGTTQSASAGPDGITGLRIGSNTAYAGHGRSSNSGPVYAKDKRSLYIHDLQLTGASQLIGCEDVVFENVDFTGTGTYQLRLDQCKDVLLLNCTFDGAATTQLDIIAPDGVLVEGCYLKDFGDLAIKITSRGPGTIRDCYVDGCQINHPAAYGGSSNYAILVDTADTDAYGDIVYELDLFEVAIYGCTFDGDPGGIKVVNTPFISVRANMFDDPTLSSPLLYFSASGLFGISRQIRETAFKRKTSVTANYIKSYSDIAMQLGDTTAHWVASPNVSGNVFDGADEALIMYGNALQFGSLVPTGILGRVRGNAFHTADATLPAVSYRDLAAEPSIGIQGVVVYGNYLMTGDGHGFYCYTDDGSTRGGIIGSASATSTQHWMFWGNTSPDTTVADSANNDMFDNSARFVVVQNNNL